MAQFTADRNMLEQWARGIMASRNPDLVIGDNYLRRWWAIPRNDFANVYVHLFLASDDDRALHDHPWASTSVVLTGGYFEHTHEGRFWRAPGDVITRKASDAHRIELLQVGAALVPAISIFMTGPVERAWGFHCPEGWVGYEDFALSGCG
jgi:hypothetical protein